ncbi:hypothetical protein PHYC_00111 [Phycisphaerales bacterium]|nr:hypothetical protein PHYC_00111 [Phycisphaerales bacterium]
MAQIAETILAGARLARGYSLALLKDIPHEKAGCKPRFGATVVDTNHPTFVFGHLCLYPPRVVTLLRCDVGAAQPPANWEALFKAGVPCQDDPVCTIYPSIEEVSAQFIRGTDAAIDAVSRSDDSALLAPNPNEASRDRFANLGQLFNFYLNNHVMMHMGQVSAWRRCFGLPSAM